MTYNYLDIIFGSNFFNPVVALSYVLIMTLIFKIDAATICLMALSSLII